MGHALFKEFSDSVGHFVFTNNGNLVASWTEKDKVPHNLLAGYRHYCIEIPRDLIRAKNASVPIFWVSNGDCYLTFFKSTKLLSDWVVDSNNPATKHRWHHDAMVRTKAEYGDLYAAHLRLEERAATVTPNTTAGIVTFQGSIRRIRTTWSDDEHRNWDHQTFNTEAEAIAWADDQLTQRGFALHGKTLGFIHEKTLPDLSGENPSR